MWRPRKFGIFFHVEIAKSIFWYDQLQGNFVKINFFKSKVRKSMLKFIVELLLNKKGIFLEKSQFSNAKFFKKNKNHPSVYLPCYFFNLNI